MHASSDPAWSLRKEPMSVSSMSLILSSFWGTHTWPWHVCFKHEEKRVRYLQMFDSNQSVECYEKGTAAKAQVQSLGAVWKSRWMSWASCPNEPYGFCGGKATLNHASALVTVCPWYVNRHPRTWSSISSSSTRRRLAWKCTIIFICIPCLAVLARYT